MRADGSGLQSAVMGIAGNISNVLQGRGAAYSGPATGATEGSPGTFTPNGATTPADGAALVGVTATPSTAWTTGWVVLGNADEAHWDGSNWVAGRPN